MSIVQMSMHYLHNVVCEERNTIAKLIVVAQTRQPTQFNRHSNHQLTIMTIVLAA